jgi:hypothetical protein
MINMAGSVKGVVAFMPWGFFLVPTHGRQGHDKSGVAPREYRRLSQQGENPDPGLPKEKEIT